jgi:regulator of protease activity HflC (stomatin/prohibitin superfamily)
MKEEIPFNPKSGYPIIFLALLLFFGTIAALILTKMPAFALLFIVFLFMLPGFFIINPNSSRVMVFFGDYRGTVKKNGFFWVNPFYSKQKVSLRAYNFDSERLKVNDKLGNPIMISVILVWQVQETYKAMFEVNNYEHFVRVQSDAAVRKLGGSYAYDNFEDEGEITLRSGMTEVNHDLEEELRERLFMAGINVIEARIGYLAYAELNKKNIVELDEDKKAAMVSNLMVVLCSDRAVTPVVNTGTLNH